MLADFAEFPLQRPVEVAGIQYSSLRVHRPTRADVRASLVGGGGSYAQATRLIARSARVPPAVILELDAKDGELLAAFVFARLPA